MDSTELRINNYVNHMNNTYQILGLDECEKINRLSRKWLGNELHACNIPCKPIPLTEDWLAKFEFKKQDDHIWIFPNNSSLRLWGFAWNVQQFSLNTKGNNWDDIITPSIKYVHQLQNLFHALTNKELTLK